MDLADHAKKFGILYLAGAILISGTMVTVAILSKQPKSDGGRETDERVALDHDNDPDKVQLWEGGPYWATKNIGAEKPWDYGYYFWWGDTVGYKRQGDAWVASDGSSKGFRFRDVSTPTDGKDKSTLRQKRWITADGVLAPKYDAAQEQWGGRWRMPTYQELDSLCDKCVWTWTTTNGVNGYVVRGRGDYASASIFLPAAGYSSGGILRTGGNSLDAAGSYGHYWSSVPTSAYSSTWYLDFHSSDCDTSCGLGRYHGFSIRPVQGGAK